MIDITLYTKADCHLCEIVKENLTSLQADHAGFKYQLHEVDITQDEELFKRYRYTIPVVKIGSKTLSAPIELHQLKSALNI